MGFKGNGDKDVTTNYMNRTEKWRKDGVLTNCEKGRRGNKQT